MRITSQWVLNSITPILGGLITLALNSAVTELRDMKKEIRSLREETKQIQIDNARAFSEFQIRIAALGVRLEEHERSMRR